MNTNVASMSVSASFGSTSPNALAMSAGSSDQLPSSAHLQPLCGNWYAFAVPLQVRFMQPC